MSGIILVTSSVKEKSYNSPIWMSGFDLNQCFDLISHYLPVNISQQITYEVNKDVSVLECGSLKGTSEMEKI